MGFASGFFAKDIEKNLHTCLDDINNWEDGLKIVTDVIAQLKKSPMGFTTNFELMQEMWSFSRKLSSDDDSEMNIDACRNFVSIYQEMYEYVIDHLNPMVLIAKLPQNILTHSVGLMKLLPHLLTDLGTFDLYKIGYDFGALLHKLFA